MKTNFPALLLLILLFNTVQGQVGPPSVTAGIDKIALQQGTLDAALIADIISTKQEELKKELMSRLILNRLECGCFAGWNFTRKSLELLLDESNPTIISKELLKLTTEFAIAIAVAEFYFQSLDVKVNTRKLPLSDREIRFLLQYMRYVDADTFVRMRALFFPDFVGKAEPTWDLNSFNKTHRAIKTGLADVKTDIYTEFVLNSVEYDIVFKKDTLGTLGTINGQQFIQRFDTITAESFSKNTALSVNKRPNRPQSGSIKPQLSSSLGQQYLPSIVFLNDFKNADKSFSEKATKLYNESLNNYCDKIGPNHILIDLVYDILLRSAPIHRLGLFHNTGVEDQTYRLLNKENIFRKKVNTEYDVVMPEIEDLVNVVSTYYYTLKQEFGNGTKYLNSDSLIAKVLGLKFKDVETKLENDPESVRRELDNAAVAIVKNLNTSSKLINDLTPIIELDTAYIKINDFSDFDQVMKSIGKISGKDFSKEWNFDDLHYFIHTSLKPQLLKLSIKNRQKLKDLVAIVETFDSNVEKMAYYKLASALADKDDIKPLLSSLIQIIDIINNSSKVSTYDLVAKFVSSLGPIYSDRFSSQVITKFTSGVDKYTTFDTEKNTMNFDVQSFAVDIYDNLGKNSSSRFGLYLSVGVNYGLPNKRKEIVEGDTTTTSINFVSEKIGVKYKILDWVRRYSYGTPAGGPKTLYNYAAKRAGHKPLVNDWYVLFYGSGLLYQISQLNSEKGFKSPLYGFATGITFLNGLDLNVGYAIPIKNKFSNGFLNIGFDIKFTEYLAALKKKKSN